MCSNSFLTSACYLCYCVGATGRREYHTVLTKTGEKETLIEVFERSFERQTKYTRSMDSFNARPLSSPCIMRPDVNFEPIRMNKTANEWGLTAKADGFLQPINVHI